MQLNTFPLVFHFLTIIQMLKESGYRKLSVRDFIFNMHTFWIHGPFTIKTRSFTCMFFNKISLNNQFFPFLSIMVQTWHFIVETNPTSLQMGFAYGIFTTQISWNLQLTTFIVFLKIAVNNLFSFFGRRNKFIINIYNNSFKHGIWIYNK